MEDVMAVLTLLKYGIRTIHRAIIISYSSDWKAAIGVVLHDTGFIQRSIEISIIGKTGRHKMPVSWESRSNICSKCSPGTHVSRFCDEYQDTECQLCEEGFFIDDFNNMTSCIRCRQPCLASFGMREVKSCTTREDRQCQCITGYHLVANQICMRHRKCKPGFGVETLGTLFEDTTCRVCSTQEFSFNFSEKERCRPRRTCSDVPPKKEIGISIPNSLCTGAFNLTSFALSATTPTPRRISHHAKSLTGTLSPEALPSYTTWMISLLLTICLLFTILAIFLICRFGLCNRISVRKNGRNSKADRSDDAYARPSTEADDKYLQTLGNIVTDNGQESHIMTRFRQDLDRSQDMVSSQHGFRSETAESLITESSTFAIDRNRVEMRLRNDISPEFIHVILKHVSELIDCDLDALMRHLSGPDALQRYPLGDAFTSLMMWANSTREGCIIALLAEGLNGIGRSDMAEELQELNPLL